jgi:hypothetical protein
MNKSLSFIRGQAFGVFTDTAVDYENMLGLPHPSFRESKVGSAVA